MAFITLPPFLMAFGLPFSCEGGQEFRESCLFHGYIPIYRHDNFADQRCNTSRSWRWNLVLH